MKWTTSHSIEEKSEFTDRIDNKMQEPKHVRESIGQKFRLKKQLIKVGIRNDHEDTKENTGATQS